MKKKPVAKMRPAGVTLGPDVAGPLVGELVAPPTTRENGAAAARSETHIHMGPLPPPETLQGYERVVPGSADRIIAMAEQDAANVRLTARRKQVFEFAERLAARIMAVFFSIGALIISYYLAMSGHDWVAGTIATTTIGGVVAAIITGRGPSQLQGPKDTLPPPTRNR